MSYRNVDDIPEDEDISRLMREREVEADIAEKTRELVDELLGEGGAFFGAVLVDDVGVRIDGFCRVKSGGGRTGTQSSRGLSAY